MSLYLNSKKANTFVYTIILINLALIIAYVVYSNAFIITNNLATTESITSMSDTLKNKGNIALDSVKQYNTNGGGFTDIIACPNNVTISKIQSGTLVPVTTENVSLTYDYGDIYCKFEYEGKKGRLIFNETEFINIMIDGETKELTGVDSVFTNQEAFFISGDEIHIGFVQNSSGDGIDDIMNSDDYRGTSGQLEYPDGYIDDDIIPRLTIFNEIIPSENYYNIFWNNYRTLDIINKNSNNNYNNSLIIKLGEISAGNVILDLSSKSDLSYDIKLIKFDKNIYTTENTLIPIESFEGKDISTNMGYIQKNNDQTLSISKVKTGNEYIFDFANSDYAIFVKNNADSTLFVQLSGVENATNKKIYINSIDDSKNNIIEVLVNNIIISGENYIHSYTTATTNKP